MSVKCQIKIKIKQKQLQLKKTSVDLLLQKRLPSVINSFGQYDLNKNNFTVIILISFLLVIKSRKETIGISTARNLVDSCLHF